MTNLTWTILFVVAIILGSFQTGFACTCLQISNKKEIRQTNTIFSGEVVEITQDTSYVPPTIKNLPPSLQRMVNSRKRYLVKFKVEQRFKGLRDAFITLVKYEQEDSPCEGLFFDLGKKYLIYAINDDGELRGNYLCSRTQPLDKKSQDYLELVKKFGSKS